MPSSFTRLAVALAAALIGPTDAYFRIVCSKVGTGRIDPLVSPGTVSGHVHNIVGGSNIDVNPTYQDMLNSRCTSCQTTADKSAYWTPQLYYQMKNGSFIEVPNGGTVVYYLGRGDNRTFEPFPPGFRMLSGDMSARSYDSQTKTYLNGRPIADRVNFACLDASPQPETNGLNSTQCRNGLRAQLQFQSCWNGNQTYTSDNSHVAYMSQIDNGVCPPTHPRHLPHIFFEVLYGVSQIDQSDGGRFVFSQGDPTGYGFHGDFFNGWDPTVLQNAITGGDGGCLGSSDNQVSNCPAFYGLDDPATTWNCPELPPFFNEVVKGNVGTSLPGCNDVVAGPGPAVRANNTCPAGGNNPTPSKYSYPAQSPIVRASPTPGAAAGPAGWQYSGCFTDNAGSTRTLSSTNTAGDTTTTESCISYCSNKGYKYAGTEFGKECWCGNAVNNPVATNQTYCTMHCSGNATQVCGGGGLISVYNNTNISPTAVYPDGAGPTGAAAGIYQGCAQDIVNGGRALTGASYTDSANMTLESCGQFCFQKGFALAGTEYYQECYCGNSLSNGNTFLSSNSSCNTVCRGNSGEWCGGGARLSVFKNPATSKSSRRRLS